MAEHILIFCFPGSQYYNLYCILAELIHHIINQIKSLLIGQSGHNTEHHHLRILVQSKLLLQRQLVGNLVLAECIDRKTFCDPCILKWTVLIIIQSIYNSTKVIGSCTHQTIETFSKKRCLDLLRVCLTYRCHFIRIDDTAF